MKKISIFAVAAFACLCLIGVMSGEAFADGDETLGPPVDIDILPGSGVVAAGVGMIHKNVDRGGDISVYVPHGAEVKQVLLYWEGRHESATDVDVTMEVEVRKRLPVEEPSWSTLVGKRIGGPTLWGCWNSPYTSAYRAEITTMGLVGPGHSRFSVRGLDFAANNGAGVIVIFEDDSGQAHIQLVDGNDYAFCRTCDKCDGDHRPEIPIPQCEDLQVTVPQTFDFTPTSVDRTATLSMLFSSVAGTVSGGNFRPSSIKVTVDGTTGSATTTYEDLLDSWDGEEFDSVNLDVLIPANYSSLTVEATSDERGDLSPASFNWIVAALSVPEEECGPCKGKITELTLKYTGNATAFIEVFQKKDPVPIFAGDVDPGGEFTFYGQDKNDTMGTEIKIYVDDDENTKIHTSCSQPIGPGLISGDFVVIEGYSLDGGLLCPTDEDDDCECDGKVTKLTLQYNGIIAATIKVVQKKDNIEIFNQFVNAGGEFTFVGEDKNGTMGTEIKIYVDDDENTKIHTSCSQPIGPGLISGDFLVIEGESLKGGPLCPM